MFVIKVYLDLEINYYKVAILSLLFKVKVCQPIFLIYLQLNNHH